MSRLNLTLKILGELLVGQMGDQSSLTMFRLNLNIKILGELLAGQMGDQSSLTMSRLNLNLKILGELLVGQMGGSIIFDHVKAKSELKHFRCNWLVRWGINHL